MFFFHLRISGSPNHLNAADGQHSPNGAYEYAVYIEK
jgi:hypothetical protein